MKTNRHDEKQLEEKLKQLPNIKHTQSKEALFLKISKEMDEENISEKKQTTYWFPVALSAAVLLIIGVFISQQFVGNQMTSSQSDAARQTDMAVIREESDDDTAFQAESFGGSEESSDDFASDESEEAFVMNQELEGNNGEYVYFEDQLPEGKILFGIGAVDQENQFTVPLTFIIDAMDNEYLYNDLLPSIDFSRFGLRSLDFSRLEFLFQNNQFTELIIDEDLPVNSASQAAMLQEILRVHFINLGISEITVKNPNDVQADLGPIGQVDSLSFEPLRQLAYKFLSENGQSRFLVPIESTTSGQSFITIDEALLYMQEPQEDFNVEVSIPEDAKYTIEINGDKFQIEFEPHDRYYDQTFLEAMIEAILMTAKSFDFESVRFEFEQNDLEIERYPLNQAIEVPLSINPINLKSYD